MFILGSSRSCSFSAVPVHVHSRQSPFMFINGSPWSCSFSAVPVYVHSRQSPFMFINGCPRSCSFSAVPVHVHSRQSPVMFIHGSPLSCSFSAVIFHVHSRQSNRDQETSGLVTSNPKLATQSPRQVRFVRGPCSFRSWNLQWRVCGGWSPSTEPSTTGRLSADDSRPSPPRRWSNFLPCPWTLARAAARGKSLGTWRVKRPVRPTAGL